MGPSLQVWFLGAKQRLFDRNNKSLWVPAITCGFMHAKQRDYHLNYRCLWVSALVCVFCMPNSAFGPELQVSMGPRRHLSSCACKTAWFAPKWQVHKGSSLLLWFCVCKTATLGLELQFSAGEETPPVVSACKQRLLDQNNKSLWVPDLTCDFLHAKQSA